MAVDGDDAAGALQLRARRIAKRPTGPQPKTATVSPVADLGQVGAEIAGREDVGEQDRLVVAHLGGQLHESDMGVGHAGALGLQAVERARPPRDRRRRPCRPACRSGLAASHWA